MDPVIIGLIVNVLASGATLVASSVAEEEIQLNYRSLKEFLGEKFGLEKQVTQLERHPSQERQNCLVEDLKDSISYYDGNSEEIESIITELFEITKTLEESLRKIQLSNHNDNSTIIRGNKNVIQRGNNNVNTQY